MSAGRALSAGETAAGEASRETSRPLAGACASRMSMAAVLSRRACSSRKCTARVGAAGVDATGMRAAGEASGWDNATWGLGKGHSLHGADCQESNEEALHGD
jgi:hypothetical protein